MITPEAVPSNPDIGSLTSVDTTPDRAVMDNMAGLTRGKIQAEDKLFSEEERDIDRHRGAMEKAFQASGVEAEKLQPWNAKEAEEKFFHNPVEAFGSLGSVFALVASAFTHAPMENALNGSAAAMNAIREGDEKAYTRAYDSYKTNMALVEKRHQMQQDLFNDATALMKTDMAAGTVKAQNLAARFGDRQSLMLLEAGMSKEFFDLQAARQKQMEGMIKLRDADMESSIRRQVLTTDPDFNSNDPNPAMRAARKLRAFNRAYNVKETPQQEILGQYLIDHPEASAEELAEFYKATFQRTTGNMSPDRLDLENRKLDETARHRLAMEKVQADRGGTAQQRADEIARHNQALENIQDSRTDILQDNSGTAQQRADEVERHNRATESRGASGVRTPGRAQQEEIDRRAAEYQLPKEDGGLGLSKTEAFDRATKEVKEANAPPITGNRKEQLQTHIAQYDRSIDLINKNVSVLEKYVGAAGLGGKVTRMGERLGNVIANSKDTDREQFMRDTEQLKLLAPRLLLDQSTGRPLSAEAGHINDIIAGTSMGDTTANTLRALRDLKKELVEIQKGARNRLGDKPGEAPAQVPESEPAWMKAPIVGGQ